MGCVLSGVTGGPWDIESQAAEGVLLAGWEQKHQDTVIAAYLYTIIIVRNTL